MDKRITSLISVALNGFLSNASAGETEKISLHVIDANNSLLRLDHMLYKYEFTSTGLKSHYKDAFFYYMQTGVIYHMGSVSFVLSLILHARCLLSKKAGLKQ